MNGNSKSPFGAGSNFDNTSEKVATPTYGNSAGKQNAWNDAANWSRSKHPDGYWVYHYKDAKGEQHFHNGRGVPANIMQQYEMPPPPPEPERKAEAELTPEQQFKDDFTSENAPEIPEKVFAAVPPFLKPLLAPFNGLEKGVLLSAMLVVLGSLMPKVFIRNKRDKFYLNVYMFICGGSSSGKNTAIHARRLGNAADKEIFEYTLAARRAWDIQNAKSQKSKQDDTATTETMPIVHGHFTAGGY